MHIKNTLTQPRADDLYLELDGTNQAAWTPTNALVPALNADMLDGLDAAAFATAAHNHDTDYLLLDFSNDPSTLADGENWTIEGSVGDYVRFLNQDTFVLDVMGANLPYAGLELYDTWFDSPSGMLGMVDVSPLFGMPAYMNLFVIWHNTTNPNLFGTSFSITETDGVSVGNDVLSLSYADGIFLGSNDADTASGRYIGIRDGIGGLRFLVDGATGDITGIGTCTLPNFISNVAIGTAPYACTSTTLNTNLNADLLDGYHATALLDSKWLDGGTYLYPDSTYAQDVRLETNHQMQFRNANQYIASLADGYIDLIIPTDGAVRIAQSLDRQLLIGNRTTTYSGGQGSQFIADTTGTPITPSAPTGYNYYSAGTVTVTNGSPTVTGAGTAWNANHVGKFLRVGAHGDPAPIWYTILTVDSPTQITLATNYGQASDAGVAYSISRIVWTNYGSQMALTTANWTCDGGGDAGHTNIIGQWSSMAHQTPHRINYAAGAEYIFRLQSGRDHVTAGTTTGVVRFVGLQSKIYIASDWVNELHAFHEEIGTCQAVTRNARFNTFFGINVGRMEIESYNAAYTAVGGASYGAMLQAPNVRDYGQLGIHTGVYISMPSLGANAVAGIDNLYGVRINRPTDNSATYDIVNYTGLYQYQINTLTGGTTFGTYAAQFANNHTCYGHYVNDMDATNACYGLYINNVKVGGSTTHANAWGIYVSNAKCYMAGLVVRGDGTIQPVQLADASAANDSIYYSTTASKLVYKDAGGTVNNLY